MSAWANLSGSRIVSGNITIPEYGLWTADVSLSDDSAMPTSPILNLGSMSLQGTIYRSENFTGSRSARLVGGFGGWMKPVLPAAYKNDGGLMLSLILGEAAREVGEKVRILSDVRVGTKYVREGAPASRVLRQLAGRIWWVDVDGTTVIGARTVKAIGTPFEALDFSGARGRVKVSTETLGDWMPGNTFSGPTLTTKTISMVMHTIDGDKARTMVLTRAAA